MSLFGTAPANYLTKKAPETPFNRARAELDGLLGNATVRAANWRLAFFFTVLVTIGLTICLIHQVTTRKVIPVIVAIDKERGEPIVLGDANDRIHKPGELEIKYFLGQFIRDVRAIPSDPVVLKQNWIQAYAYMRKGAATLLNNLTNDDETNPLKKVGEVALLPQLLSIVQVPGSDAYQAHWKETLFNKESQKIDEYTMLGTFSVEVEVPTDLKSLNENPLGLYITDFQWNRELKQ